MLKKMRDKQISGSLCSSFVNSPLSEDRVLENNNQFNANTEELEKENSRLK